MAQYSLLEERDVQTILSQYDVGKVVSFKILSGGSENTNYVVYTSAQSLVLTVCEQKSLKEATDLASLLEYLKRNGFTTSKLIKTKQKELIITWNDKPLMLKEYIEGTIVEDLSDDLLTYLGKELAKLHGIKAPAYLPNSVAYGAERFYKVAEYAPNSSFFDWLKDVQNYIEHFISEELPKSLIHSDIFYNNIVVTENKDKGTIMDFEEACCYYRVFDIGMMLVGTCCDGAILNLQKAVSVLKGYQQKTILLDVEKKALLAFTAYAAAATAFWRHQNFNYVNITPEKKEHYLEMKLLTDAIMSMPNNALFEFEAGKAL